MQTDRMKTRTISMTQGTHSTSADVGKVWNKKARRRGDRRNAMLDCFMCGITFADIFVCYYGNAMNAQLFAHVGVRVCVPLVRVSVISTTDNCAEQYDVTHTSKYDVIIHLYCSTSCRLFQATTMGIRSSPHPSGGLHHRYATYIHRISGIRYTLEEIGSQ